MTKEVCSPYPCAFKILRLEYSSCKLLFLVNWNVLKVLNLFLQKLVGPNERLFYFGHGVGVVGGGVIRTIFESFLGLL